MRQQTITGIDIGNHAIKTVIASVERGVLRPHVIGVGNAPSNGLRRGVVFDMEETIHNVRESVNKAESMAGSKVGHAYVSINGLHIRTQPSRGVIAVSRADNEITRHDIDRVIDAASTVSLPSNREIIHVLPRSYTIDAQEHVKNALGMKGVRLEAEVLLIEGLSPYIRNIAKCVNANDIDVAELVFAPLAASKSILDKHQKEHGVMSIDFGGGVSSLALFHEGEVVHTATLPVGSRHITNDIAVAFRTSMDKAERIKCIYGSMSHDTGKNKIDLSDILEEDNFLVPSKDIARIVDSRVSELFDMITAEIKKVPRNYLLPAGVVLAGGGANLEGLLGFTKNKMRLSVKLGEDGLLEGLTDKISDPSFAVAAGLVAWGFEKEYAGSKNAISSRIPVDGLKKAIGWFKNFLP